MIILEEGMKHGKHGNNHVVEGFSEGTAHIIWAKNSP
jgi:hypothetical protein